MLKLNIPKEFFFKPIKRRVDIRKILFVFLKRLKKITLSNKILEQNSLIC